jgi:hypothetical protein
MASSFTANTFIPYSKAVNVLAIVGLQEYLAVLREYSAVMLKY